MTLRAVSSNKLGEAMLEEFKKFAMRGNVVDLAVGVIIGVAFGAIINSLVGDIIMPIIGGRDHRRSRLLQLLHSAIVEGYSDSTIEQRSQNGHEPTFAPSFEHLVGALQG